MVAVFFQAKQPGHTLLRSNSALPPAHFKKHNEGVTAGGVVSSPYSVWRVGSVVTDHVFVLYAQKQQQHGISQSEPAISSPYISSSAPMLAMLFTAVTVRQR